MSGVFSVVKAFSVRCKRRPVSHARRAGDVDESAVLCPSQSANNPIRLLGHHGTFAVKKAKSRARCGASTTRMGQCPRCSGSLRSAEDEDGYVLLLREVI